MALLGRLRVNMGNIYVKQKKYPQAVKMYRMALDQIDDRFKAVRWVGNVLLSGNSMNCCGNASNVGLLSW